MPLPYENEKYMSLRGGRSPPWQSHGFSAITQRSLPDAKKTGGSSLPLLYFKADASKKMLSPLSFSQENSRASSQAEMAVFRSMSPAA